MVFVALTALAFSPSLEGGGAPTGPTVKLTNGTVAGTASNGIATFLGIPYAAPPIGSLRFRKPAPHASWSGVRDATARGNTCVMGSGKQGSEDCLVLNVFTPLSSFEERGAAKRPVLFYIHGGGFVEGSATTSGENLSQLSGQVVVAIQYRLGALGFLSTEAPPPNLGLEDQLFALRWVNENAAAFGGDADSVMIFGCSAGGASVAGLLISPAATGLYHAAGIESPGGHQGWMGDKKRSDDDWMDAALNLNNSEALAKQLGCAGGRSDVGCLQALDVSTLYAASSALRLAPSLVVDGAQSYPLREIRQGRWSGVPVIVGGQSCESCGGAFAAFGPPTAPVSRAHFRAALVSQGFSGVDGSGVGPDTLEEWYAHRIAREGRWRTFARILSDSGHACSSALHAEALATSATSAAAAAAAAATTSSAAAAPATGVAAGRAAARGSVWRYFFAFTTAALPGATHGADESWILDEHEGAPAAQVALSRDMALWWASLNARGDPNADASDSAPWWNPYAPKGGDADDAVMFMGEGDDPTPFMNATVDTVRAECEHWKAFLGW